MSKSLMKLVALVTLSTTVAITTGCSAKRDTSEVVVAPMAVPGGYGSYDGGSLTSNSTSISNAAAGLPNVVYFGFDKSDITDNAAEILNDNAAFMNNNPSAKVLVAGNTDARGSREYNMALGERRAVSVKNYLVSKGVNAGNIETISYGEERPAVEGTTEADYAKNRRAVLNY